MLPSVYPVRAIHGGYIVEIQRANGLWLRKFLAPDRSGTWRFGILKGNELRKPKVALIDGEVS